MNEMSNRQLNSYSTLRQLVLIVIIACYFGLTWWVIQSNADRVIDHLPPTTTTTTVQQ